MSVDTSYVMSSMCVALDLGEAEILENMSTTLTADATLRVTHCPKTSNDESIMDLFRHIEFANVYSNTGGSNEDLDGVMFRMKSTHYNTLKAHLNNLFTPSFSNTDAHLNNNTPNNKIRYLASPDASSNPNQMEIRIIETTSNGLQSDVGGSPAPGNYNNSVHGCLGDVHISYITAALTGSIAARAIIGNEDSMIDLISTNVSSLTTSDVTSHLTFGEAVTQAFFPSQDLSGDGYYYEHIHYQNNLDETHTKPIKQLLSQMLCKSTERFYGYYAPLSDPSVVQTLYTYENDTLTLRSDVSHNYSGSIVYNGTDTIVPILDVNGNNITTLSAVSLPLTDVYQPLPFAVGDSVHFLLSFQSVLQLCAYNGTNVLSDQNNLFLKIISTHAHHTPATFSHPVDPTQIVFDDTRQCSRVPMRMQVYNFQLILENAPTSTTEENNTTETSTEAPAPAPTPAPAPAPTPAPATINITYQRITNVGRDNWEYEGKNYFSELYHSQGQTRWEYPSESQFADNASQFGVFSPEDFDIIIYKYSDTMENPYRVADPQFRIEHWSYSDTDTDNDGVLIQFDLTQDIYNYTTNMYETTDGNTFKNTVQAAGDENFGDAPGYTNASQVYLYNGLIRNTERDTWTNGIPRAKLFDLTAGTDTDTDVVQATIAYQHDGTEVHESSRIIGRTFDDLFTNVQPPPPWER